MLINYISIYLFISIIVTTFLTAFIQSRGKAEYLRVIFLLCIAMDIYMFGYLQELNSGSISQKLFWNYFQYLGIPFVSALWLTVALMYTNHFFRNLKIKIVFIYAIPVLTLILRLTNSLHHLYFNSFSLQTLDGLTLLIKNKGIWFMVQSVHSALLVSISLVMYIIAFIKNKDYDGEKIIYMFSASIFACLGLLLNVLKIKGFNIDYMVLCLPITAISVTMAILRNDFLEIKMLARDLVFENNEQGIILLNNTLKILDFNETAKTILSNHNVFLRKEPLDAVILRKNPLNDIFKGSNPTTWKDESIAGVKYYEIITTDVLSKKGTVRGKIKTIRDITEIQLRTNHLKVQATIDELSGLLNRREFLNSCQPYLNNGNSTRDKCYLLMIDIDFFKRVNDTYGHIAGDYVIKRICELIRQEFMKSALVGRLGGEEFAVFIKAQNIDSAYMEAEKLRQSVETLQIVFEGKIIKVTISIGLAGAKNPDSINSLINKADKALYASKNDGRNKTSLYEHII